MKVTYLLVILTCAAALGHEERATEVKFRVGYRVLDFTYPAEGKEKVITAAVWYPTEREPKPYNYGGAVTGRVSAEASLHAGAGPYPLLVFSHGFSGGGIGAVFLSEALAARGWIVAAPDHHDSHTVVRIRGGPVTDVDHKDLLRHARRIANSKPEDRAKYFYRLDEMKAVIDGMLSREPFNGSIDRTRVAVGGHSLGGFTAIGVSGPIPERHDSRIKAVLLFSTGAGGYMFTGSELAALKVPSMLLYGELEKDALRGRESTMAELSEKIFRSAQPPKYLLEIKGADHLSFNNRFAGTRWGARAGGSDERVFDTIGRYSIAFLEKHVAGKQDADGVLRRKGPMITRYERDPAPGRFGPEFGTRDHPPQQEDGLGR